MRLPDERRGPYWEPRDIWLGVYWTGTKEREMGASIGVHRLHIYVCLIPCFPIRLTWLNTYNVGPVGGSWRPSAD